MKLRSLLYVPASENRFIAKAHMRGADAIILDLEDSVAPKDKDAARANLPASIASVGQSGATVFVRINAEVGVAKLDADAAISGGAFGLLVAKARREKLSTLNSLLDDVENSVANGQIKLVAMIEDAAALLEVSDIAVQPRVFGLILGSEDFATATNAMPDPDVLRTPKLMLHYAAKAHGLFSFGLFRTVADYSNLDAIAAAAGEAKRFGFDGATCVHPSAITTLNTAFSPSPTKVAWARRVLSRADSADKGAFEFEGQMVDKPVLMRARQILDWVG